MSLLHRYNGWSMNFNMHRWTWMNENKNDGRTPKISITTGTTKLSSDATGLHSGWEAKLNCLRDTASSGAWRLLKFLEHMKKRGEPWPRDRVTVKAFQVGAPLTPVAVTPPAVPHYLLVVSTWKFFLYYYLFIATERWHKAMPSHLLRSISAARYGNN